MQTTGKRRRAVFLDRDGTIIYDVAYPRDPGQVRLVAGAPQALAQLQNLGFALVLVSNQSGIGRGLITLEEAQCVHQRMVSLLEVNGVRLDDVYYCPHAPEFSCTCRKPMPGLILEAASRLEIDVTESFMVGDNPGDIEAGRRAGCRTVQLRVDRKHEVCTPPDIVADDWETVLSYITDKLDLVK